jgi:hypothetical protein
MLQAGDQPPAASKAIFSASSRALYAPVLPLLLCCCCCCCCLYQACGQSPAAAPVTSPRQSLSARASCWLRPSHMWCCCHPYAAAAAVFCRLVASHLQPYLSPAPGSPSLVELAADLGRPVRLRLSDGQLIQLADAQLNIQEQVRCGRLFDEVWQIQLCV